MPESFFIVAHERGQTEADLPTWADRGAMPVDFADPPPAVRRTNVDAVPRAFQLLDLLTPSEARGFIDVAERLGFHADAPLEQPEYLRRNHNLNWVVSERIVDRLWTRASPWIHEAGAVGLNARFRFYRYREGDFFMRHRDVAWPHSRVVDDVLVTDSTLVSRFSFIVFLNDDFDGGATLFEVGHGGADSVAVRTPAGAALCFPHGTHPDQCVHSSTTITRGAKYIIRTDIMFPAAEAI